MASARGTTGAATPPQKLQGVDIVFAGLFCLLWSSAFTASKIALLDSPPLVLLAARYLTAGVILLGIAALLGPLPRLARRDYVILILVGLFLHALHLGFGFSGLSRVTSGFAVILLSTSPILIAFLAAIFLGERLTLAKLAGLALGITGVAIVFRSRLSGGLEDPLGALFLMIAVSALVVGTVIYKRLAPAGGLWYGQSIQFLAAGIGVLPFMFWLNDLSDVNLTTSLFLSWSYIVVFQAIGAYSLWLYLVSHTSASAASSLLFLTPPLGLFFGWLVLDEPVAVMDLVGIIPIAIGIRLATRS